MFKSVFISCHFDVRWPIQMIRNLKFINKIAYYSITCIMDLKQIQMILPCSLFSTKIKSQLKPQFSTCKACNFKYLLVIFQASFQFKPFRSMNILISSGIQRVGWVSFICTATFSGNSSHLIRSHDLLSNRAIISWREAEHKVYCCFNLRIFPSSDSSPG